MGKTSITVESETLNLVKRIRGWRQYQDGDGRTLDRVINELCTEEIQRIELGMKGKDRGATG